MKTTQGPTQEHFEASVAPGAAHDNGALEETCERMRRCMGREGAQ